MILVNGVHLQTILSVCVSRKQQLMVIHVADHKVNFVSQCHCSALNATTIWFKILLEWQTHPSYCYFRSREIIAHLKVLLVEPSEDKHNLLGLCWHGPGIW